MPENDVIERIYAEYLPSRRVRVDVDYRRALPQGMRLALARAEATSVAFLRSPTVAPMGSDALQSALGRLSAEVSSALSVRPPAPDVMAARLDEARAVVEERAAEEFPLTLLEARSAGLGEMEVVFREPITRPESLVCHG